MRKPWRIVLSILVFSVGFAVPDFVVRADDGVSAQETSVSAESAALHAAERAFDSGDFVNADRRADECEKSLDKLSPTEKSRFLLVRARLGFAFKKNEEMERWLRELARHDSSAKLSPLQDPPQMFAAWKKILGEKPTAAAGGSALPEVPATVSAPTPAAAPQASAAATTPTPQPATDAAPDTSWPPKNVGERYRSFEKEMKPTARFGLGLLPFGVGHFVNDQVWQGATFMVAESALILLASGMAESTGERLMLADPTDVESHSRYEDQADAYTTFGSTGFFGLWGMEVLHLLPTLAQENPNGAKWTRFALSFAPFGVAQVKNGEPTKALGLAASESLFILLSGALPRSSQRELASLLFGGCLFFGMADGWLNHDWDVDPAKPADWSLSFMPLPQGNGLPPNFLLSVTHRLN